MNVGIVAPGIYLGGAEVWMNSLVKYIRSVHWCGLALRYPGSANPQMAAALSEYVLIERGPEAVDRLYQRCDVVLLWGVLVPEDQRIPARPRRAKVVLVSHGVGEWTRQVFGKADQADGHVAVGNVALAPIPEPFRVNARVIPNCFDPERLTVHSSREEVRESWGVRPGEYVVGYLGRLSDEKNPGALVELVASTSAVRGVFVGPEYQGQDVRILAEDRGVTDRVTFTGPTDRPGDALAGFDHVLLPSHEEACAITLLEAWAVGVPVINTPVGLTIEHPDLVRSIPLNPSGEQIATALWVDLTEGTSDRVRRAREVAWERYSPEVFARAWGEYLVQLSEVRQVVETPTPGRSGCGGCGRAVAHPATQ